MRTAFIEELIVQARLQPEIFLIVGDLGFSVIEPFATEFPDRFLNAGVAEQNMTGIAAGLASEGYHVFTYSIANFPTLRCLEQIRNDVCYHRLPVTIVAVGAGMAYGNLGFSHHALQDIAVMRSLPWMRILSPADPGECRMLLQLAAADPSPTYLRLGKAGEEKLHAITQSTGTSLRVLEGDAPVALAATGSILKIALEAARLLSRSGVSVPVFSCPVLGSNEALFSDLWNYRTVVSVEEHGFAGGFGSLLKEIAPSSTRIISEAVPVEVMGEAGSQEYLRGKAGLTVEALVQTVCRHL